MTSIVVIPTFNERENVKALIKKIRSVLPKTYILIVDDSSPDGTAKVVLPITKKDKKVLLLKRKGKGGRGSAVIDGFKYGLKNKKIDFFIEMDSDFSHNPEELENIIKAGEKSNVVLASRYLKQSKIINWPIQRRIFSFFANKFAKLMLNIPIADYTNGYRGYSRRVLEKINLDKLGEKGYAVLMEMAYVIHKTGFKFKQIPSVFVNRSRGKSNTSIKEIVNALNAPLRIKIRHKSL